jgi:hypothetical protein
MFAVMMRTQSMTTGVLFVTATVTVLLGSKLSMGASVAGGVLLELVAAGTSVGIAISLYPALKPWGSARALGAVVFRSIEAMMYSVAAISLLVLRTLAEKTGSITDAMMALRANAILAGVFAFCVGASMYYSLLLCSRLIPRWLSAWGIVGVLLLLVACVRSLFTGRPVTGEMPLVLPIALQEMVLAACFIVRGFDLSKESSRASTLRKCRWGRHERDRRSPQGLEERNDVRDILLREAQRGGQDRIVVRIGQNRR